LKWQQKRTSTRPVFPQNHAGNKLVLPDQNREEMDKTPALRGRRKGPNKMFGDASEQHVAANAATPSTNSPSTVVNLGTKKHRKNQA
jgi:hypothetical protein